MLKNKRGDIPILFAIGVSVVMFGYIGVLQLISVQNLKLNINTLNALGDDLSNEFYAWHGYLRQKAIDGGKPPTDSNKPVLATHISSRTVGSISSGVDGAIFCGASGGSGMTCIKAASGSGNGNGGSGSKNPAVGSWTAFSGSLSAPVGLRANLHWTGKHVITWGGYLNGVQNTGAMLDPDTGIWTALPAAPSALKTSGTGTMYSSVWMGNKLFVWGGDSNQPNPWSVAAIYDPATLNWTQVANPPMYTNYSIHTTFWTGSKVLIWDLGQRQGAMYDPQMNSWSRMPSIPGHEDTSFGNIGWTGTQIIVAGGQILNPKTWKYEPFQGGAVYEAASNSWKVMKNESSVPLATIMNGTTPIWTGEEMLFWGRQTQDNVTGKITYFNTGAAYNPTTDTWSAMSTENAPAARMRYTAVWTGKQMAVWGGYGEAGALNSGGLYDRGTDTWTTLAVEATTPEGSFDNEAVWTGSKMVVWGGRFDNGGILDLKGKAAPDKKLDPPTMSLAKNKLAPGQYFTVKYANFKTTNIRMHKPGTEIKDYLDFTTGTERSGDIVFVAPKAIGTYEIRGYVNGGTDATEVPIIRSFTVDGNEASCGENAPTLMPVATMSVDNGETTHNVTLNGWGYRTFQLSSRGVAYPRASKVAMTCTGDTSELELTGFPTDATVATWGHPLQQNKLFKITFTRKTPGQSQKAINCTLNFCDGKKMQSLPLTFTGGTS